MESYDAGAVELHHLRIPGVLQRLALTYGAVALMQAFFAGRGQYFDAEQVLTQQQVNGCLYTDAQHIYLSLVVMRSMGVRLCIAAHHWSASNG